MPSHVCPCRISPGTGLTTELSITERARTITRKKGNGSSDYWADWGTPSTPTRNWPDRLAQRANDVIPAPVRRYKHRDGWVATAGPSKTSRRARRRRPCPHPCPQAVFSAR
ncbi:hypothetical protein D0Z67_19660 [Streptomyces seoulensis]|uniref:Uncharacterized protein n=1 Tax=Streptomyces seoulensis TaxID=73044 RepID=A0A4P6TZ71_STRSO|nr:hypothetical protein D0Z67_19660 [Streptomyces seoulensis]